jgi:hypothetical protein
MPESEWRPSASVLALVAFKIKRFFAAHAPDRKVYAVFG